MRNETAFSLSAAETDERFLFCTEPAELSPLSIYADHSRRFRTEGKNLPDAVKGVLEQLQIPPSYRLRLSMTVYYEYPMLPGRENVLARLPVIFFPDFQEYSEIEELLLRCELPKKEGGKLLLDTNVCQQDTRIRVLHAEFEVSLCFSCKTLPLPI